MKIQIRAEEEAFSAEHKNVSKQKTAMCKVMQEGDGYWIYHKNKVELTQMFS